MCCLFSYTHTYVYKTRTHTHNVYMPTYHSAHPLVRGVAQAGDAGHHQAPHATAVVQKR